ncbi:MAG: glycine betaine ABC transporter substrate-binding protein [Anaerolineae bacterium]
MKRVFHPLILVAVAALALLAAACNSGGQEQPGERTQLQGSAAPKVLATTQAPGSSDATAEAVLRNSQTSQTPSAAQVAQAGATATAAAPITTPASAAAASARATSALPSAAVNGNGATVRIGSKDFTEQFILGEIYAQLLEANGYKVDRKLNLGATQVAEAALERGDIDLYPEYTGTGLTVVLGKDPISDPKQTYDAVVAGYKPKNLTWLDPAPMNNTQALAMKKDKAAQLGIKTLSDLSQKAPQLRAALIPEFLERPDGLPGLKKVYGGFDFASIQNVAIGVKYQALLNDQADVTLAFGTDGQIAGYDLMTPVDDKHLWPPYQVAPVVRNDTLQKSPGLATLLNSVAPKLTDQTMQALNWEVDGKKREPADVAKEFLVQQGFVKQ